MKDMCCLSIYIWVCSRNKKIMQFLLFYMELMFLVTIILYLQDVTELQIKQQITLVESYSIQLLLLQSIYIYSVDFLVFVLVSRNIIIANFFKPIFFQSVLNEDVCYLSSFKTVNTHYCYQNLLTVITLDNHVYFRKERNQ